MNHNQPAVGRFIGQSVLRREDPRLLSGQGLFVDDVSWPGTLHAAFVRSPIARGRVVGVDASRAATAEGVVAVFTAADIDGLAKSGFGGFAVPSDDADADAEGAVSQGGGSDLLAGTDVRYVGDPIVLVVAENRYLAEDACELVDVDLERLPPVLDLERALAETEHFVHPQLGTNVAAAAPEADDPELDAVSASAATVVTETIRSQRQVQVPMEGRGIAAHWQPQAGELLLYVSTQTPHITQNTAAGLLGISDNQVRVVKKDVGGSFGQKVMIGREESCVILATGAIGQPVKWIEDRWENLTTASQARDELPRMSMAFDSEGRILGMRLHYMEDVGAAPVDRGFVMAMFVRPVFPGPYRVPRAGFSNVAVYTNTTPRGAYRGPWMMETLARERLLDIAAQRLGIDPVELRRRNVIHVDELPYRTATGMVYDAITPSETLEQALAALDLDAFRAEQATARAGGRYLGMGLSLFVEPSGVALAMLPSMAAVIQVELSGKVRVSMSSSSHGQSLETTVPQLVADYLGVELDDVSLVEGDTAVAPYGGGTGGSRMAVFTSGLAKMASENLRAKIFAIAAEMLEASADDLVMERGIVSVRGTPARSVHLPEIAMVAMINVDRLPAGMEPGLEATARFKPSQPFTWSNACHLCTCEVDARTGHVKLLRYVVSEDCGVVINPMVVEGQIAGGVVQGIGGAILEHFIYDADGNPLTTTFLDYLLPTATDVPTIEYGHIETPSSQPGGVKGMGEGGAIGAPAAVLNAVGDALAPLGVDPASITSPVSPSAVLDLIDSARSLTS